jgi:hypothetical protein
VLLERAKGLEPSIPRPWQVGQIYSNAPILALTFPRPASFVSKFKVTLPRAAALT